MAAAVAVVVVVVMAVGGVDGERTAGVPRWMIGSSRYSGRNVGALGRLTDEGGQDEQDGVNYGKKWVK